MNTYIIAEAGVNHNGSLELARKLVEKAREAGADCVKFQTFLASEAVSRFAQKAQYQKETVPQGESQLEMVKRLELSFQAFEELKVYCEQVGIDFLSTPFDLPSIDFLHGLGVPFWKIPSGEITNLPYLLKIARTGRPVVLSTGMSRVEEIERAVNLLREHGTPDITLLHCNTEYPTPFSDVNLQAMKTLKERFHCPVGYSDHTQGIEIPIAAVAMGAAIIEKHFTLDRTMKGPDHRASLEPEELKAMVTAIRHIEQAMGDGIKQPSPSEEKNISVARKSIVARCTIAKGEILTENNLTTKRPGDGISPMEWFEVLGTTAVRDFQPDEKIER